MAGAHLRLGPVTDDVLVRPMVHSSQQVGGFGIFGSFLLSLSVSRPGGTQPTHFLIELLADSHVNTGG